MTIEMLNAVPAASWSQLWPIIEAEREFGREVLSGLAGHHEQLHSAKIASALPEEAVASLYVWMHREFPPREDPQLDGMHAVGGREMIGHFREGLLSKLRERGSPASVREIRRIARELPQEQWLQYTIISAERTSLRKTWLGVPPSSLFEMVGHSQTRLVENQQQLMEVVIDSLKRLQLKLHGETPAVIDIWDKNVPKDEKAFADYIKRHLQDDLLASGVIASRETEVRRGEETDITVDAIARHPVTAAAQKLTVIIEVKGCWHQQLKTAMKDQLKERYLKEHAIGAGLYLVGWFRCEKWANDPRRNRTPDWSVDQARDYFDRQAQELSDERTNLHAFILDTGLR